MQTIGEYKREQKCAKSRSDKITSNREGKTILPKLKHKTKLTIDTLSEFRNEREKVEGERKRTELY